MRKNYIYLLTVLFLLSACQGVQSPTATNSTNSAYSAVSATNTATKQPQPTITTEKVDIIGTAAAADALTKAAGPTKPPTKTPRAVPTLDPNAENWWNDAVFYEIFVRSFYDSNGDGIGDIQGLIQKLDYLNDGDPATNTDLGITAIWLMPIMESPSYHGYDVSDYYQVDPEYGTNEDFRQLMQEAHKRGIRIVIDLVINHTSNQHPWFIASDQADPKFRDYYIWSSTDPNYTGPWGQDVWYPGKNGQYYALFWSGMPDLNLTNPAVTQEIYDITEFWLKDMNADGFRMDAVRHLIEEGRTQENTNSTHEWLYNYHKFYRSLSPSAFTVGETWTDSLNASLYAVNENDIPFEFDLSSAYLGAAGSGIADSVNNIMETVLRVYPPDQYGVFLTNHDQNRTMSVLRDVEKAKLAASLLLTSPGVPFLYYGEEVAMLGTKPDEDIRLPMPWTGTLPNMGFSSGTPWRTPAKSARTDNIEAMRSDPNSLWSLYRDLIQLRANHSALRRSETKLFSTNDRSLVATLRFNEDEALVIIVNTYRDVKTIPVGAMVLNGSPFSGSITAEPIFGNSDQGLFAQDTAGNLSNASVISVPARQAIVFKLDTK